MQIFIVSRDSADGPELDCFTSEAKARQWAKHIGAEVQTENTLDDMLADLIASRPASDWSGSPCPLDPDNWWVDDDTGERVNATTGERRAYTTEERERLDHINGWPIAR